MMKIDLLEHLRRHSSKFFFGNCVASYLIIVRVGVSLWLFC